MTSRANWAPERDSGPDLEHAEVKTRPMPVPGTTSYAHTRGVLEMLRAIGREHGASIEEMMSGIRLTMVVRARHAGVFALSDAGFSASETARILGMNHSTVLTVIKRGKRNAASQRGNENP